MQEYKVYLQARSTAGVDDEINLLNLLFTSVLYLIERSRISQNPICDCDTIGPRSLSHLLLKFVPGDLPRTPSPGSSFLFLGRN